MTISSGMARCPHFQSLCFYMISLLSKGPFGPFKKTSQNLQETGRSASCTLKKGFVVQQI